VASASTPGSEALDVVATLLVTSTEAGVDLAVIQALMGHEHVDAVAAYVHLAPTHVRAEFDAARARQPTR